MRRFGALMSAATALGLCATTVALADQLPYNYAYPLAHSYYGPDYLELIGREAEGISKVLSAVKNEDQRSTLAEDWIQFSRRTITKSLDFREQWLTLQKQQAANQQETQRLHVEMLRMEGEIEKLRTENLKLQNANLQLQLLLKQQATAQAPNGQMPNAQTPTATPQTQGTSSK